MKKTTFLFLLITTSLVAQKINFTGKLLGNQTQKPIVYANISFLKGNLGISTIEDGTFNLEIDKNLLNKKIHISCLNYKDTIVFANQLYQKTVFLQSKSIELTEIVISKKVDREIIIDKYKRRHLKSGFSGIKGSPWIVTKFFKYKEEYNKTPYIKDVTVYLGWFFLRKKATFRVRLFAIDTKTGKPSEDIVKESIMVSVKKVNGKIKIDISKFDVEFPEKGFFVGLERLHIPSNFHEEMYTMKGSRKKYKEIVVSPTFAATHEKNKSIWIHSSGKWYQFDFYNKIHKAKSIVPAISLTLSN